jgi:MraZ protein
VFFTGRNELSIDGTCRLAIPAKIRSRLDPEIDGESFYATRGPNGAVWLWPQRTFEEMAGSLEPTLAPAVELMDFDELTFPEAEQLDLDSAGRIRLPQELVSDAGLGTKVLLVGVRNHLEIWDPEVWEARRRERAARRAEVVQRARPWMSDRKGRNRDLEA